MAEDGSWPSIRERGLLSTSGSRLEVGGNCRWRACAAVMLSAHATRSRICSGGATFRDLQPSTLRSVICPLANNAQNSMQAVSAQGSMHWVLMMALVVRMDFHWSLGKRRKVKS